MRSNYYKTAFVLLFILSNTVFAQDILYIGNAEDPADSAMIESLEYDNEYTFSITVVSGDDFATQPYAAPSIYNKYDAIFISETVSSSVVGNFKEAGFPIPCVTNEGYAVRSDRWGFLADDDAEFIQPSGAARTAGAFTLVIQDVDHWIADRYPADYNLRWTDWADSLADQIGVTGFQLYENVSGAVEIGQFKSDSVSGFPGMWAIPDGATLFDGTVLPNMVIIGTVAKALGKNATDEYNRLIYYSLLWVTEKTDELGTYDMQSKNLSIWPNPTDGIVNLTLTSPVSGNAIINIYNIAGTLIETINSDNLAAGRNTINLDISDRTSGLYIFEVLLKNDVIRGKIYKN